MLKPRYVFLIVMVLLVCALGLAYARNRTLRTPSFGPKPVVPRDTWQGAYALQSTDLDALAKSAAAMKLDFLFVSDPARTEHESKKVQGVTLFPSSLYNTSVGDLISLRPAQHMVLSGIEPAQQVRGVGGLPIISTPRSGNTPWTGRLDGAVGIEIAEPRLDHPLFFIPPQIVRKINPAWLAAQMYTAQPDVLHLWDQMVDAPALGICPTLPPEHFWLKNSLRQWIIATAQSYDEEISQASDIMTSLLAQKFYCYAGLLQGDPQFYFIHENEKLRTYVSTSDPRRTRITLLRGGAEILRTYGNKLTYLSPQPGNYRVEVAVEIPNLSWGTHWATVVYSQRVTVVQAHAP